MILLTSPEFIKSVTNISDNMQDKFINTAIREAQQMDLQQVIGSRLLNKLCDLVASAEINLTGNTYYKELIETAQWYLAYDAIQRLVIISGVHLDNMGPNKGSDEHNNTLDLGDAFKIEEYYQKKADFYCRRVQEYCIANRTYLPELTSTKVNEMKACLNSAASTNIFLGGARGKLIRKA